MTLASHWTLAGIVDWMKIFLLFLSKIQTLACLLLIRILDTNFSCSCKSFSIPPPSLPSPVAIRPKITYHFKVCVAMVGSVVGEEEKEEEAVH